MQPLSEWNKDDFLFLTWLCVQLCVKGYPDFCSIMDAKEFEWESQLRFYWEKEPDELVVRQCTGEFGYGYEYMGLNGRLVITPLTDRIYLTLTQVMYKLSIILCNVHIKKTIYALDSDCVTYLLLLMTVSTSVFNNPLFCMMTGFVNELGWCPSRACWYG